MKFYLPQLPKRKKWYRTTANLQVGQMVLAEVESSRTDFEVLGLEGQVLGLEASSPRKLACPRLEDSSIF